MTNEQATQAVLAALGGDEMLKTMSAKRIEPIPLGVSFILGRENPGDVAVKITVSFERFDLHVDGHLVDMPHHNLRGLQDWELVAVLRRIAGVVKR